MKKISTIVFVGVFFCITSLSFSMESGRKPSIKIIYEISPEVESYINSIEYTVPKKTLGDFKLKNNYSSKYKDGEKSTIKDENNFLTERTKTFKINEALDTKKITIELYDQLVRGFTKKGFSIDNENSDYVVSFLIDEVSYDDYKGECYVRSASYKLIKGIEVVYQGNFVSPKKKTLFGGQYTQLLNVNKVANKIIEELDSRIKE